jgi:hypothetical protein
VIYGLLVIVDEPFGATKTRSLNESHGILDNCDTAPAFPTRPLECESPVFSTSVVWRPGCPSH